MIEIKIAGNSAVEIMREVRDLANRMERNSDVTIGQIIPAEKCQNEAGPDVVTEAKPKPAPKAKAAKPKQAETEEPKEVKQEAPLQQAQQADQNEEPQLTKDDVKTALARVINMEKEAEAKEILDKYGAAKISELKEKDYAAVIADLKAV